MIIVKRDCCKQVIPSGKPAFNSSDHFDLCVECRDKIELLRIPSERPAEPKGKLVSLVWTHDLGTVSYGLAATKAPLGYSYGHYGQTP